MKLLSVFTSICLVVTAGVLAEPDPKGPRQRIDEGLESARKLLVNAHMKIGKGFSGVATGREEIEDPTPVQLCCSGNLSRIDREIKKILTAFGELEACYEQEADSQGQLVLAMVNERMTSMINTLTLFERARKPDEVIGTVEGSKRAFRNLSKEIDNLPPCPAEDTSE